MSNVDLSAKIPNNVDLVAGQAAAARARAVAARLHPVVDGHGARAASRTTDIWLRTAISVDAEGWAHFDYVKMPDYRWGIFLADPQSRPHHRLRRQHGRAGVAEVPGEHRNTLRRLIVTQGDTEPASRRAAAHARPQRAQHVRHAEPLPGERGGGAAPVGDGLPPAQPVRPRRPRGGGGAPATPQRQPGQAAHPRRLQPADRQLARLLHVHDVHGPRREVPAPGPRRERLRSPRPHHALHADGRGAPHVRGRDRGGAHRPAHGGVDEGATPTRT